MAIVQVRDLKLGYGAENLFEGAELQIDARERVCLVGRNGAGKSTFLKLLAGQITADSGEIIYGKDSRVAMLSQTVPKDITGTVSEVIALGFGMVGEKLNRYQSLLVDLEQDALNQSLLDELEKIQKIIEDNGGWEIAQKVDTALSRFELDGDAAFLSLSGGLKRRVLLAQVCVTEPALLLLDEPTNHLDIRAIEWLEAFLLNYNQSILFVTHDRAFLQNVTTRIVELDRGAFTSWPGDYENYLEIKEHRLETEAVQNAKFDKKLAEEEKWIRKGIQARRTRNEGRVRALKRLREEHRVRRNVKGNVSLNFQTEEKSGKLVVDAKGVEYSYQGEENVRTIVKDFSVRVMRSDKIGIVGRNGVGKTTLIRLLLGELSPQKGTVELGTNIRVAYFDQMRGQLNPDETILDNVCEGSDYIDVNGSRRHGLGYLQDFLFSPQQARTPVSALSGGEQNRVLLAKLFVRPANFLVLDEPTNDLDVETLELLEELLVNYQGTLIVISHDRAFLNNVVSSTLVFESEDGKVQEYVGGYDDWLLQRPDSFKDAFGGSSSNAAKAQAAESAAESAVESSVESAVDSDEALVKKRKLSYRDQQDLESLPKKIEKLESSIEDIHTKLADPDIYQKDPKYVTEAQDKLSQYEADLQQAYNRWEELED